MTVDINPGEMRRSWALTVMSELAPNLKSPPITPRHLKAHNTSSPQFTKYVNIWIKENNERGKGRSNRNTGDNSDAVMPRNMVERAASHPLTCPTWRSILADRFIESAGAFTHPELCLYQESCWLQWEMPLWLTLSLQVLSERAAKRDCILTPAGLAQPFEEGRWHPCGLPEDSTFPSPAQV